MMMKLAMALTGIGLFFFGMGMVGRELKKLSGRRMRLLFGKWAGNPVTAFFCGFISGMITQSTSNASLIITNLVKSRILPVRKAIPIVAASNIGTVLLVFLTVINIKLGVLLYLGTMAILYSLNKTVRERPISGVMLGVGILLFGFSTFVTELRGLFGADGMKDQLLIFQNPMIYYVLPFALGATLRFLSQSTSTVSVIGISLCQAGILDVNQTLFVVFGAPLGSVLTMTLAAKGLPGASKQVAYFQILFESLGTIIMTGLLILELMTGFPLMRGLLGKITVSVGGQIAFGLLFMRILPYLVTLAFLGKLVERLERWSPPASEDRLATAEFIYDGAEEEPETAMDLVEKEQERWLGRFPMMLEAVRQEHDEGELQDYEMLYGANRELSREIQDFMGELFRGSIGVESSERLIQIKNRQQGLELLEESLRQFIQCVKLAAEEDFGGEEKSEEGRREADRFTDRLVESLHLILVLRREVFSVESAGRGAAGTVAKGVQGNEPARLKELGRMTSDKEKLMEGMRKPFLEDSNRFSREERGRILELTNLFQRIIWLLHNEVEIKLKTISINNELRSWQESRNGQ